MIRLQIETLEGRALMSAVAPMAPAPETATVAFTPPIGSNKGSFAGDGWWLGATAPGPQSAPVQGICAVWHD